MPEINACRRKKGGILQAAQTTLPPVKAVKSDGVTSVNDVGRRRLVAEAQLQLVKMLPHQAIKAVSVEVNQFVVRPRADEPAGHRAAPFVKRQFTQLIAPFLPYGLFSPAQQRRHTGFFIPAPHSSQKRSVRMICRGIQYCSIGSHSRSGISIRPNRASSGNRRDSRQGSTRVSGMTLPSLSFGLSSLASRLTLTVTTQVAMSAR